MAKRVFFKNSTGNIVDIFIQDASTSSGAGLINVTTAINAGYRAGPTGTFTTFALAAVTSANSAHSSAGGIFQHSSATCPGLYRFDVPDAAMVSTPYAIIYLSSGSGGTNMAPVVMELEIRSTDGADNPTDVRKFGGTAVTGRDIGASVLLSSGTGVGQVVLNSGVPDANVSKFGGTTVTGRDIGASVLLSSGTGAGQIVLAAGQVTVGTNSDKTGYSLASNAVSTSVITSGAFNQVADTFLDRDMSTGTDSGSSAFRTPRQALRMLRNKWTVSGGTLTVYKEDDITSSWTGAVTTSATADPIIGNDPA